jgi:hypothetical protein
MQPDNAVFKVQLAELLQKAGVKTEQAVRNIAIGIEKSIIEKSPFGDPSTWASPAPKGYVGGRFRANWNVSLDALDTSTSEQVDPTGQISIDAGVAAMSDFSAGQTVYITNSLPYAGVLEYGRASGAPGSQQAPNGMVRITVLEVKQIAEAAISATAS